MTSGHAEANRNLLAIATAVAGVTFLVYTVLVVVLFSRIQIALSMIEQASKCLMALPSLFVLPVFLWLALCSLFVWCVCVFVYLAAAGEWDSSERKFQWNDSIRRAIILHFFGLLWGRAFILAVGNLVVAGASAQVEKSIRTCIVLARRLLHQSVPRLMAIDYSTF